MLRRCIALLIRVNTCLSVLWNSVAWSTSGHVERRDDAHIPSTHEYIYIYIYIYNSDKWIRQDVYIYIYVWLLYVYIMECVVSCMESCERETERERERESMRDLNRWQACAQCLEGFWEGASLPRVHYEPNLHDLNIHTYIHPYIYIYIELYMYISQLDVGWSLES